MHFGVTKLGYKSKKKKNVIIKMGMAQKRERLKVNGVLELIQSPHKAIVLCAWECTQKKKIGKRAEALCMRYKDF